MRFLVITHVFHKNNNHQFWGYEPYVKEMNLWFKTVDEVVVIAPLNNSAPNEIDAFYNFEKLRFINVPVLRITDFINVAKSLFEVPIILFKMGLEMHKADHIHLRCPGNMGLLGCIAQVFFPHKHKTAKYAGNWDPNARQPWNYRFQKWMLSNEFLTRNMQVLVYGEWPGQSKNIKPFFTASYSRTKAPFANPVFVKPYRFLFVGTLSKGKNPIYAVKLMAALFKKGVSCTLNIYGEGAERNSLEQFIAENAMGEKVTLHGNQPAEIVETAYKKSNFLLLPSISEGWPKAVAEAMRT